MLPVRVGVRATQLWLRAAEGTISVAAGATSRLVGLAVARATPHPIAVMQAPVKLERFWDQPWKASVIWCRQSINPPVAHQRRAAERLNASWHELDTGHYPMLTEPEALARLMMAD